MRRPPYLVVCVALGLLIGWTPMLFHGPIHEKFDIFYLNGPVMVWAWYLARLSIGLWVGITALPREWYLRGPLCGALAMIPLGFVSLGVPGCGFT